MNKRQSNKNNSIINKKRFRLKSCQPIKNNRNAIRFKKMQIDSVGKINNINNNSYNDNNVSNKENHYSYVEDFYLRPVFANC